MWSRTQYVYRPVHRAVDCTDAVWTLIHVDVISVMSEVFAMEHVNIEIIILMYWKFPMLFIKHSVIVWFAVKHSVKSTALVDTGNSWEGSFEHLHALFSVER